MPAKYLCHKNCSDGRMCLSVETVSKMSKKSQNTNLNCRCLLRSFIAHLLSIYCQIGKSLS